jgi:hypothetical protein
LLIPTMLASVNEQISRAGPPIPQPTLSTFMFSLMLIVSRCLGQMPLLFSIAQNGNSEQQGRAQKKSGPIYICERTSPEPRKEQEGVCDFLHEQWLTWPHPYL